MGVSVDPHDRWSTLPRLGWLWAGVLLPPVAWVVHLSITYAMASFVCHPPVTWPLYLVSVAALGLSLWGGWISRGIRQASADETGDAPNSTARARFMAQSGLLLSGIFSLAILAQTIPMFVLEPCRF